MRIKCVLVFLSIHLLKQISIIDAFTKPCNASLETVSRVTACPSSNSSYEAAAAEKNCLSIAADHHQCESFEYHCVLSNDTRHAVEVCAPYLNIIGQVCARFSSDFNSIIRIDDRKCIDCPYSYNSTNAFQYQECYVNLTQDFTTQVPLRTTAENITAGVTNYDKVSTTAENITAGVTNYDKVSNGGNGPAVIVFIVITIFAMIVFFAVALFNRHLIRKHLKCFKVDRIEDIEMETMDLDSHTNENTQPLIEEHTEDGGTEYTGNANINENTQPLIEEHTEDGGPEYTDSNVNKNTQPLTEEHTEDGGTEYTDANINENTQPLIEEHTEDGGPEYTDSNVNKNTQPLTEEHTEDVGTEYTDANINENTQPLIEEHTEDGGTEYTDPNVNKNIQPLTEEHTEDVGTEYTDANVNKNTQPLTEEHTEDVGTEYTDANINENTQPLIEEHTEDGGTEYTDPNVNKNIQPLTEEHTEDVGTEYTDANVNKNTQPLTEEHTEDVGTEYTDANVNKNIQPLTEEHTEDVGTEYTDANVNKNTQPLTEEHTEDVGTEYTDANVNKNTQPLTEEHAEDGGTEYTDANINEKTQHSTEEHTEDGETEFTEQKQQKMGSPRPLQLIQHIRFGNDIRKAVLKTKNSTTKIDNKNFLKTQINYLLKSLRNPTDSWTKDDLVETVRQMINKLYERNALDPLEDFLTAICEDENINNTLRICQKEIFEILDSLENKYHADIKVSEGCVCFTFYFHTDNDLESFLVKVQEGQEELRKDISDFLLNKTLMKVFRVDSIFANLVISKVTVSKGSVLVYQKDFLKSTTAEDDMTAEGSIEDVILKKDLPESKKIELESKVDNVLSSMNNPESMQENDLKTLVEKIVYEVIANKRIDLLTQFATAYEEEETQNALDQHGANINRTLIPIFEDVNLILKILRKSHLMITEKEKKAYDEAVANRFRSSQEIIYPGYKSPKTRTLSFRDATNWMKSRKQEFAKFGFFYKGTDLTTICFHCGCLKDDWTEEDDILAAHLFLTESCEYVNYMISALPLPF